MEIAIAAVGRLKSGPETELCDRYLDRARKAGTRLGFRGFSVHEVAESKAQRSQDRIAQEEAALLTLLGREGRVVCLHEKGDSTDSMAFAAGLRRDADNAAAQTLFVIGGPDGMGSRLLSGADRVLSFGRLTWPHQIVRVLLAEQLYRAMSILSGHPYHRA